MELGQVVEKALEEAMRERGHINVLIAGRTGVGKSTLINAIFQGQYAATGQGRNAFGVESERAAPAAARPAAGTPASMAYVVWMRVLTSTRCSGSS